MESLGQLWIIELLFYYLTGNYNLYMPIRYKDQTAKKGKAKTDFEKDITS